MIDPGTIVRTYVCNVLKHAQEKKRLIDTADKPELP